MSEIKINEDTIEEIILNFQKLKKFVEGKKPIKPELILFIINQLHLFNTNLRGTAEVVNEFNTQYSSVLLEQIKKNNKSAFEMEKIFTSLDAKLSKIVELEGRIENIKQREDQVDKLLKSVEFSVDKFSNIEKLLENSKNSQDIIQKSSKSIDKELVEIKNIFDEKTEELTHKINELNKKTTMIGDERAVLIKEKEKWLEERDVEREKWFKEREIEREKWLIDKGEEKIKLTQKEERLQAMEDRLAQYDKDWQKQFIELEKSEADLLIKEKMTIEKDNLLGKLQVEVNEELKENRVLIEDIKIAQDKLMEDMQEAAQIMAEKTHLEKVEELITQKQVDIKEKNDLVNKDKKTLLRSLDNFSSLLDKTESNLALNEIYTQTLDANVDRIVIVFNNFTQLLNQLEQNNKILKDERIKYETIGNKLHDKVDEIDKQLEEILKMDVLSRYIHQATLELRESQVSLKVLLESSTNNVDKNSLLRKDITKFLGTATGLLDSVRDQIEYSITSDQKIKELRQDLITVHYELKDQQIELDKIVKIIDTKENYLSKLDEKILQIEGSLVKSKLESAFSHEKRRREEKTKEKKLKNE